MTDRPNPKVRTVLELTSADGTYLALTEGGAIDPRNTHAVVARRTNGAFSCIVIDRESLRTWCQMMLDATA